MSDSSICNILKIGVSLLSRWGFKPIFFDKSALNCPQGLINFAIKPLQAAWHQETDTSVKRVVKLEIDQI